MRSTRKIVDEDSAGTEEEYIRCSAKNDVLRSILGSSNDPRLTVTL